MEKLENLSLKVYDVEHEDYIVISQTYKHISVGLIKSDVDLSNLIKWMALIKNQYDKKGLALSEIQKNIINYLYAFYVKHEGDDAILIRRKIGTTYALCLFLIMASLSAKCQAILHVTSNTAIIPVMDNIKNTLLKLELDNVQTTNVFNMNNGSSIVVMSKDNTSCDGLEKHFDAKSLEVLKHTYCNEIIQIRNLKVP